MPAEVTVREAMKEYARAKANLVLSANKVVEAVKAALFQIQKVLVENKPKEVETILPDLKSLTASRLLEEIYNDIEKQARAYAEALRIGAATPKEAADKFGNLIEGFVKKLEEAFGALA